MQRAARAPTGGRGGRRLGGAELGEDGADVAQAGEHAVELRLVGDRDGDGRGAVVVAGQVELAEPGRPVVVEVAVDADRVRRGGGVHESAPAGWGRGAAYGAAAGGAADRPLGDGQVDHPGGALGEIGGDHAGAEDRPAEALREGLGAGGQSDRVGPDHPRPVGGDVAATYGGDAEHQAGGHRGPEDQAEHVEQVAGAGLRLVEQRHPERRDRRPAGRPRPAPGRHDGARPGAGGGTVARTAGSRRARRSSRRRCAPRAGAGSRRTGRRRG